MNLFSAEGVLRLCEIVTIAAGLLAVAALVGQSVANKIVGDRKAVEMVNLQRDLADAKTKQAEAETELKKVSERVFRQGVPRFALVIGLRSLLKDKPKGRVELLYSGNEEASMTASVLQLELTEAGWQVTRIEPLSAKDVVPKWEKIKAPLLIKAGGQPGTIAISFEPAKPFDKSTPSGALSDALSKLDLKVSVQEIDLPDNLIRVIVGPK